MAVVLAVVATSVAGGLLAPGSAGATPSLAVSPTSTVFVTPSSSTTLSGLSISGDSTDQLQATVATNLGTLSITTTTGLTLAYNNSWSGTQSITFTGLESAVNTALATTTLTTSATTGTAQISLTAMVAQSGYNYLASNQHFYEYVPCAGCSWTTADAGAQALSLDGQPGYLATIPNSTVNTFISTKIANATNVWFGARSYESLATDGSQAYAIQGGVTYARVWRWVEGVNESPIAGGVISECTNQLSTCSFTNNGSFYSSWASGEPNNSGGSATVAYQGEYVAVTNWSGTSGSWNDLNPTNDGSVSGYVVEFGGKTNSNASLGTGFAGVVTTSSNVLVAAAATAPGAPTITATPGDSSAALSWNPPASNGASITSYQVSTDGGTTWSTISTSSSNSIVNGNTVTTVSATVTPLTNGTTYQIEVRAVNSVGPGAGSNSASVTPAAVPGAPTGVSATAGNSSAAVSWSAPASNGSTITSYTVTSSPGGQSCVWTSGPLTCTVNGLSNGTPYTFSVTATNGVGTGPASSASTAVTPAAVPGAPTGVSATAGNSSAAVSWSAPASNGSTITSYTVTSSPGGQSCVWTSGPLTCTVNGLSNGTPYTFSVTATNGVGTGPASSASTAVTPAAVPGAPTGVSATAGNSSAAVSWSAPASNGSTITSYTVTSSPGGQSCVWTSGPLTCTVNGLSNGTPYTFSVTATNGVGTGPASSASTAVTPAAVPGAPTGVSATAGNSSAAVSWSAPASNGSTITSYTVTSSPGGQSCVWTSGPLTCTVNGLSNGTPYTFSVTATNGVGTGPASSASTAVTPAAVPGAPTGVSATASDGVASVSFTAPVSDGGSAITGYTVTAYPGGATTSCSASPCTVTGLTDGTPYTFLVSAINAAGTGPSSTPSTAVIPAGLPGAPTGVSAKAGDGAATVSWTAPVSNGSPITGYVVTTAPGGTTTSCSASPCAISGLNDGTGYTFTVTAINGVGTGPASSASNAVTPAPAELGIALRVTPQGTPQDRSFLVSGSGLEAGSTVTIVLHSSPVTLATVTVGPDGSFSTTVTLPTDLAAGTHTIIASGTSAFGLPVTSSAQFVQDPPDPPAPALPTTGFDAGTGTALGAFALLTGFGLIRLGRRRARRA